MSGAASPRTPIRVLHLGSGNLFGGIESLLVTYARQEPLSPELEHEFALCFEGRLSRELRALGAKIHLLGQVRLSRPWTVNASRRHLADLLKERTYDVILCHGIWLRAVFGPALARMGATFVAYQHDAVTGVSWQERLAARAVPKILIANSAYTASALKAFFAQPEPQVLHPPVELPNPRRTRSQVRAELGTGEDKTVIIQVGRMAPLKGHRAHIQALAELKDLASWEAWIVGGAQRPEEARYLLALHALVAREGLGGRVRFLGEREDVPDLLHAADVFCQPNETAEAFGISFVEALGAACPVVTHDLGGAREIIDEECGFRVPPGTGSLGVVLRGLINNSDLRTRLGAAGPARARQLCDPTAHMKSLHLLLQSACRNRSEAQCL